MLGAIRQWLWPQLPQLPHCMLLPDHWRTILRHLDYDYRIYAAPTCRMFAQIVHEINRTNSPKRYTIEDCFKNHYFDDINRKNRE